MSSWFEALKDLLFPPSCLGCAQGLSSSRLPLFCPSCRDALVFLGSPCCRCCGIPFATGEDHLCGDCLQDRSRFDLARSLLAYQPPVSDLILSLKFGGQLSGLATFQTLLAGSELLTAFSEPDLVLPVPLHVDRLRQRGFNQALVIARACFPQWQEKIGATLLLRQRATTPQSQLKGKDRRRSLHRAFHLADPSALAGKKVLLVDDVLTTGSTVRECSATLRRAGAQRIEVFTLARSLPPGLKLEKKKERGLLPSTWQESPRKK